jgi:hypothetical protein
VCVCARACECVRACVVSSVIRCDNNPLQLQRVDRQKPNLQRKRERERNKEIKVFVPETH